MKAIIVYYKNGGPEVFQWTDVDVLACGPDQVVIKNEYISIEGGDLIAREICRQRLPHHRRLPVCWRDRRGRRGCAGSVGRPEGRDHRDVGLARSVGLARRIHGDGGEYDLAFPAALSVDIAAAIPVTFGTAHECLFEFGHRGQVSPSSFMPAPVRLAWRPCSSRSGQVRECSRPHRMTQSLRA